MTADLTRGAAARPRAWVRLALLAPLGAAGLGLGATTAAKPSPAAAKPSLAPDFWPINLDYPGVRPLRPAGAGAPHVYAVDDLLDTVRRALQEVMSIAVGALCIVLPERVAEAAFALQTALIDAAPEARRRSGASLARVSDSRRDLTRPSIVATQRCAPVQAQLEQEMRKAPSGESRGAQGRDQGSPDSTGGPTRAEMGSRAPEAGQTRGE